MRRLMAVWLVVGLVACSGDGGVESTSTASETSSSVSSEEAAGSGGGDGSETDPVVAEFDAWVRVDDGVGGSGSGFLDSADGESGLVAVGFAEGSDGYDAAAIRSLNGFDWTHAAALRESTSDGTSVMYAVAEADGYLIAVGTGCDAECTTNHPRVWRSADGDVWSRPEGDDSAPFDAQGSIWDIARSETGWVAVGNIAVDAPDGLFASVPAVWGSPDGEVWSILWTGDPGADNGVDPLPGFSTFARMNAVAVGPDGRLVSVGLAETESGQVVAAAWTSSNGLTWTQAGIDLSGVSANRSELVGLAASVDRYVAVGSSQGTEPVIATSLDGREWTSVDTSAAVFEDSGSLADVVIVDGGFVSVGPDVGDRATEITLWGSYDGVEWSRLESFDSGQASSLTTAEHGLVVTGVSVDSDSEGAVWVGPVPDMTDLVPTEATTGDNEEPPQTDAPPPNLGCEELREQGFNYPQVLAYWMFYGQPDNLGGTPVRPPCEGTYPAEEVDNVLGPPPRLAFEIERHESEDETSITFAMSGPAVAEGLVCANGVESEPDAPFPSGEYDPIWSWGTLLTCEDGSGTFEILNEAFFNVATYDRALEIGSDSAGTWRVVSGSGNYENLRGGGAFAITEIVVDFGDWSSGTDRTDVDWGLAEATE